MPWHDPDRMSMCFLPQQPYLPLGDLNDVLSYPLVDKRIDDDEMRALLSSVGLEYLLDREAEQDAAGSLRDWDASLSLGEKQRLSLARLFFHRPVFAICDGAHSTSLSRPQEPERELLCPRVHQHAI